MSSNARNRLDTLAQIIGDVVSPGAAPSQLQAGEEAGGGPVSGFDLTLRGADGAAQHWFRWGIDTWDDPSAIFY